MVRFLRRSLMPRRRREKNLASLSMRNQVMPTFATCLYMVQAQRLRRGMAAHALRVRPGLSSAGLGRDRMRGQDLERLHQAGMVELAAAGGDAGGEELLGRGGVG